MNDVLVLLFSAGGAALLTSTVAGIRSLRAQSEEVSARLHRAAQTETQRQIRDLNDELILEMKSARIDREADAAMLRSVIVTGPGDRIELDQDGIRRYRSVEAPNFHPYGTPQTQTQDLLHSGRIKTSFDYIHDAEVLSTEGTLPSTASEEDQARMRNQLERTLRADGTGVKVTDKVTWSKNPTPDKTSMVISAEVRRSK